MNRLNMILAAVLAVQLLAIFVFASPFGGGTSMESLESIELFEGIEPDQVVRMAITDGDENRVELAREAGDWVLASSDGYPADGERVAPILEKVTALTGGRPVTRRARNHAKLEVASSDYSRKIELFGDGGTALGTLFAGTSPNVNQLHVRPADEEAVYVASGLGVSDLATSPERWIDTRWLTLESDDIRSLVIERGGERIAVERGEDGGWKMTAPEEQPLPLDRVEPILSQFRSAYLSRPIGTDDGSYGFDEPTAVITIETETPVEDGAAGSDDTEGDEGAEESAAAAAPVVETHRIFIGGEADEGDGYFVKRTGFDFVVKLMASSVELKFFKNVEDFLPAPPEEESSDDGTEPGMPPGGLPFDFPGGIPGGAPGSGEGGK